VTSIVKQRGQQVSAGQRSRRDFAPSLSI